MEKNNQLTLNFSACYSERFSTCREFVEDASHHQPKQKQVIAMEMDYSPSQFGRKLSQNPNDSARFTLDDLESWIEVTGDFSPIYYLIEKHCMKANRTEELEQQIQQLQDQLARVKP